MPRKPRVQFSNAIYHIVTRGDGKQKLFHDDGHYQRFTEALEAEVLRSGWQVIAYCWMPNHIHALIKTPEPNLSNGMQHWLSGYANWYAKRNRRKGHLYQGRFKAFQVEDSSYFCTLSRYIHVNPCVGQKPLAEKPEAWLHSSYGNYIDRRRTHDWLWKIGSLAPKPFCKKSFCWPSQLGVESHFPNAIQDSRPSGSFRKSRISSTFPPTPMSVSVVVPKAERSRHCFAEN